MNKELPTTVWAFIDYVDCFGTQPEIMLFYNKKDADDMLDSMGLLNGNCEVKELEITR
jgi:hypothetical protein